MSGTAKLSRRTFLLGAGAFPVVGLSAFEGSGSPLFTAGFVSDTHVTGDQKSVERVRRAYRFFRSRDVDLVVNLGDIANRHDPAGYRFYRDAREKAYADTSRRPKEVFVWANHDRINFVPGVYGSSYEDSFAAAKPILGITNGMYDRFEMGGYVFLVFPQNVDLGRYEKAIASATADSPGKPVFVLHHVPPKGTTYGSDGSGDARLTKILSRYPQVVNFSGHTHGSLRNELMIWQDGFTAVNCGCLSSWRGEFLGRISESKQSWECSYLEFYADRLVIRRFSLSDGAEIGADAPWTIVWGDLRRYRGDARAAKARAPQFPAGATLGISADAVPMRSVAVKFPASDDSRGTLGYRLKIETRGNGGWKTLAIRELCGDFHREESVPSAKSFADAIPAAFFDEGVCYRFTVAPYGFFGNVGRELSGEFTAPKRTATEVLCEISAGLPVLKGGDRWELPDAVQKLPGKTPLRIIVDAESERHGDDSMKFRMECFPKKEAMSGWVVCEEGKVSRRYVVDFDRGSGKQPAFLSPTFSPKTSTLRLMKIRIERLCCPHE